MKNGLRLRFLSDFITMAEEHDIVILFCENIDPSDHPQKNIWLPDNLPMYCLVLPYSNVWFHARRFDRVFINELLPRPDVRRRLIQVRNELLYATHPVADVSPNTIRPNGHYKSCHVHINNLGVFNAACLFNRIMQSVI